VAAFLLAALAVWVLKALFGVDRPEGALIAEQGFSYPSGHATLSLVGYGLAAWLWEARLFQRRALIAYALTLALAIGISRVLLGVHTVADVAGGFLLGGAILLLTRTLLEGGRGGCSR
jgi:undecaprenyl-diphosphatase